jgi:ATP-dependent Lon protease
MEIPDRAGVMVLGGCHLFPQAMGPLFIFEPRYRTLLAEALGGDRMFCLAMQQPGVKQERPCRIAGLGLIRVSVNNPNGTSNLMLQGLSRVRLGKQVQTKPYRVHLIEPMVAEPKESLVIDALMARTVDLVETRLRLGPQLPLPPLTQLAGGRSSTEPVQVEDCIRALRRLDDPGVLADLVTTLLLPDPAMRQLVLQAVDLEERLRHVVHFLMGEVARLQKSPPP